MSLYWTRITPGAYKAHSFGDGTYYAVRNKHTGQWLATRNLTDEDGNMEIAVEFGQAFKTLKDAQTACDRENNGFRQEARRARAEEERIAREEREAKFEAERAERLANTMSHANHDFGFDLDLTADQINAMVKAAARYIGDDTMRLRVQIIGGQARIEFGSGMNDVREITVVDSEAVKRS